MLGRPCEALELWAWVAFGAVRGVGRGNPGVKNLALPADAPPLWDFNSLPSRRGLPSKTVGAILMRDGSTSRKWEADLMQAAYFLERFGRLRLDAETSRASLYITLQKDSANRNIIRAGELRRLIRAKEAEIVVLDGIAEAVRDRLVARRAQILLLRANNFQGRLPAENRNIDDRRN